MVNHVLFVVWWDKSWKNLFCNYEGTPDTKSGWRGRHNKDRFS